MVMLIFLGFTLFISQFSELTSSMHEIHDDLYARNRLNALQEIGVALEEYYQDMQQYPATLDVLAATPNYYHVDLLRQQLPRLVYDEVSVTNANLTYQRIILAEQSLFDVVDAATFFSAASNSCGATAFNVAGDFCPPETSLWLGLNNLNSIMAAKATAINALDATLSILLKYHGSTFTDNGGALSVGDSVSLPSAVGYAGTLANCTGSFSFQGAVLGCNDLFNQFGEPVVYNLISPTHMALLTRLPFNDHLANPLYVVRDIQI